MENILLHGGTNYYLNLFINMVTIMFVLKKKLCVCLYKEYKKTL